MAYDYDGDNIFAKILRGEIPNRTVLDTEHALAFEDISPRAPVHVLVIPKGSYVCFDHFQSEATAEEIVGFFDAVRGVCEKLDLSPGDGGKGYRLIANTGTDGVQEVPHFHVHVLAGRPIGPLVMTV